MSTAIPTTRDTQTVGTMLALTSIISITTQLRLPMPTLLVTLTPTITAAAIGAWALKKPGHFPWRYRAAAVATFVAAAPLFVINPTGMPEPLWIALLIGYIAFGAYGVLIDAPRRDRAAKPVS